MAKVICVIETEERRGRGLDGDPVRLVKQYFTFNGKLLAEYDEWMEQRQKEGIRLPR